MAGRAQSSQPTIFEELAGKSKLTSTIRSQSSYAYTEARGGHVSYDRMAGNGYGMLANALKDFDRTLIPVMERRLDRKIEEGVAAGTVLFSENPDEAKNRTDWKAFTETNPQYAGDNPWLQRGYEQARLRSLGLEADKRMTDSLVQSGMINETDPQKVQSFVEDQAKKMREEFGLDTYADKLFLAQNYTALEAKAKQGVLAQHSQYLRAQQEELTAQQYTDLSLKMLDGLTDPARGGGNPDDPFQGESIMARFSNAVAANVQEATANGVRNAKAPDLAANMFLTAYSKTKNPAFLSAMETFEINGAALINHPGIANKIETLERQRLEQGRADLRHAWAMEERADKQMEKKLTGMALQYALTGKPVTAETLAEMKIPDRFAGVFAKAVGTIYEGMNKTVQQSPATRHELALALMAAKRGELTDTEAINAYRDFGSEGKVVFDAHMNTQTEEGKLLATHMKSGGDKLFSMLSRTRDTLDITSASLEDAEKLTQEQKEALEAMQIFQARFEEAFKNLAQKNKGKVSPAEAKRLETQVIQETLNSLGKQPQQVQQSPLLVSSHVQAPLANTTLLQQEPVAQPAPSLSRAAVSPELTAWLESKEPGVSKHLSGLSDGDILAWLGQFKPELVQEYNNMIHKGGSQ